MKVFSRTHTIMTSASAAVGSDALSPSSAALINHPPGTLLDIDDSESAGLIERGVVETYDAREHGNDLKRIVASARGGDIKQSIGGPNVS